VEQEISCKLLGLGDLTPKLLRVREKMMQGNLQLSFNASKDLINLSTSFARNGEALLSMPLAMDLELYPRFTRQKALITILNTILQNPLLDSNRLQEAWHTQAFL